MRPYSMDLRQRVLADCDDGMKTRAVATKYRVSESWVRRLKQRRAATGETAPRSPRNPIVAWPVRAGGFLCSPSRVRNGDGWSRSSALIGASPAASRCDFSIRQTYLPGMFGHAF